MKRNLFVLSLLLCLALLFCACGNEGGGSSVSSNGGASDEGVIIVDDFTEKIGDYTIVRPEKAGEDVKSLPSTLHTAISKATGERISVSTDWDKVRGPEIIIGNSNREACAEIAALLSTDYDYAIKMVGENLVIMGLTEHATVSAVDCFIANFIVDGQVNFPVEDGYVYLFKPNLESFKIGGVDYSEFKYHYIVAEGSNGQTTLDEVNEINDRMGGEILGKKIEVVKDDIADDHMIYYDRSGLGYEKGSIKVENGDLYLYGSYHSIDYVVDYFFDTVIGENKTVDLPEGFSVELSTDDLPTLYTKEDLMAVLEYVYNTDDLTIVGDEMYNSRRVPSVTLDNFMEATGTHPAILGVDMGRCGFRMPTLPDSQWMIISQLVCELVDYAADGGIITIGSHFTNPKPGFVVVDGSEDREDLGTEQIWIDLVTEGTETNATFKRELDLNAIVFKALDEANVPIIWRPFHECNGGWFWWTPELGETQFDAKYFVDMWVYVYEYFEDEWGLTNLLWEYSPSTSNHMDVMYLYPGDEYCDMVGIDWYTGGDFEIIDNDFYYRLMETGKVTNLAEMGIGNSLMAETKEEQAELYTGQALMNNVYEMYREEMKVGYFMNYTGKTGFLWLPGGDEVMQSERVLELKEMPALFEKVTGFKCEN